MNAEGRIFFDRILLNLREMNAEGRIFFDRILLNLREMNAENRTFVNMVQTAHPGVLRGGICLAFRMTSHKAATSF